MRITFGKGFVVTLVSILPAMCARTDGTPKPNLSGEWTLDLLRSDFGRSAPPMSATLTIQHREPDFTVRPLESAAGGPPV
jgi:hypothetical protein